MAPLTNLFPAAELPSRIHTQTEGFTPKHRKGAPAHLSQCPLYEMVQYSCNPPDREPPAAGEVVCESFVRLFRRCANGFTVETTAWEEQAPLAETRAGGISTTTAIK
ncbi:hypothetical protein KEM52_001366 [Ascosphaera acerosa]|nr:hypothetical protein KEM52_001366 [Ascosphaera acerosa]